MTENEFILNDRIQKIQHIIKQYGIDNFSISFSGGLDSTVLSELIDIALPNNKIPRVYANTGVDLNLIVSFVTNKSLVDDRFHIIQPKVKIQTMLNRQGYPFKSKHHSYMVNKYQHEGLTPPIIKYLERVKIGTQHKCPNVLLYQFTDENNLKISDKCCYCLKEKPLQDWNEQHNKKYFILGIMASEGGRRDNAKCLAFRGTKLYAFQPLAPLTKEWENWFISTYNIDICEIYKPPYNFKRTGCKGCPFNVDLQKTLDIMEKFFPNERKQCELIWKPVYDEYRRIGYRLKK